MGKFTLEQAMKAQRGCRGTSLFFFLTSARDEGGCSTPHPKNFSLGKVIRYLFFRRIGGNHGPSGRVQVELVTTRIQSRTVQTVANRNTDYAILADKHRSLAIIINPYAAIRGRRK
jgi:hypothetical protein